MAPYMSLLLTHFVEILQSFEKKEKADKDLWLAALQTLSKSFAVDDGGASSPSFPPLPQFNCQSVFAVYWRDDRLRQLSAPLIAQIPVCAALRMTEGKPLLSETLSGLVECLEDDSSIKSANLAVLMHTRSDDARVRLLAVQCAVGMWKGQGHKLRGASRSFLPLYVFDSDGLGFF